MTAPTTSRLRSTLLVVGAVLGSLCLLSAMAAALLGVTPLVFRSGSMSPEIPAGGLGLARSTPAAQLAVGDVVSVEDSAGTRITHRVVSLTRDGAAATLTLQGDANDTPDAEPYTVRSADRVFAHAPYLGYVVAAVSGPLGIFAGGLLSGVLLMIAFAPGPRRPGGPDQLSGEDAMDDATEPLNDRAVGAGLRRVVSVAVASVLVVAGAGAVPSTLAAFTDASTATSTISALTVTQPANLTCTNNGTANLGYYNSLTLAWTDNTLLDYQVAVTVGTTTKNFPVTNGSQLVLNGSDVSALLALGSTMTVKVTAQPAGAAATVWTSAATSRTIGALSILGATWVRC